MNKLFDLDKLIGSDITVSYSGVNITEHRILASYEFKEVKGSNHHVNLVLRFTNLDIPIAIIVYSDSKLEYDGGSNYYIGLYKLAVH